MTRENDNIIALFPLHTVLFPGGPLPLRIFEPRYLDMVRNCTREQQPFGVLLIEEGADAGPEASTATTATVGCSARIADFYTLPDGLLGISCVGERKFRVERAWRAADGLNMGEIEWLAPEPAIPLPQGYAQFGATVQRALAELADHYQHVEKKFDDAAWVGARLTELLPIELNDKQALLELDDPIARLDALLSLVPGDEEKAPD